jgi:hypothetical protein
VGCRKLRILASRELLLWVSRKDIQVATVEIIISVYVLTCQSQDSNWVTHRWQVTFINTQLLFCHPISREQWTCSMNWAVSYTFWECHAVMLCVQTGCIFCAVFCTQVVCKRLMLRALNSSVKMQNKLSPNNHIIIILFFLSFFFLFFSLSLFIIIIINTLYL